MATRKKLVSGSSRGELNSLPGNISISWALILSFALLLAITQTIQPQSQLDQAPSTAANEQSTAHPPREPVVPAPEQRPNVRVNVREWTRKLSEEIRLVANRTSCPQRIAQFYQRDSAQFQRVDAAKLRDSILMQINALLGQHRAAVNAIVAEAEQAAAQHQFQKDLRINYTDVHRLRNELESQQAQIEQEQAILAQQPTLTSGQALTLGTGQSTSISGGTPVPGPPEWQTQIKSLAMQVNRNFGDIPVNTSMSAVHLPLPIYAGSPEIMNGIAWSEHLDKVFRKNLEQFAHVHHQYYGDHLGFLRTFPAHKWRIPRTDPDLFDARTRPWYIAGAATPKDVVILVDSSGSMTGLRREIAKGVVFELLDTLTINDHFAVMRFAETVTPVGLPKCSNLRQPRLFAELEAECPAHHHVHQSASQAGRQYGGSSGGASAEPGANPTVECANFRRQWETRGQYLRDYPNVVLGKNGTYITDEAYRRSISNVTNDIRDAYLLPATSRNVRSLKSNFTMPTAGIANFTHALMGAFELLQAYNRTNDMGSQCQQAIMLITDGAIRAQEDVFNRYNYPGSPVRVFTYMIGREVGNIGPTKEMACRNRGYYTHVINLSEVREQVQKYLPVMARPLVLAQQHVTSWTNAYGDETYQVLTDWVLEMKRRERARIMLSEERERLSEANSSDVINIELTNIPEYDELPLVDEQLKNRIICEDAQLEDSKVMEQSLEEELDPLGYNELACHWTARRADLLTSVVRPVFDLKNSSLFFERILSKNVWTEKETRVRNAQLLGVAAVDLRISDIMRAVPSHLLGPNAYPILMGQNGFVMHHPDLRALLEDPFDKQSKILKPYFNAVDLTHIEQVHHRNETPLVPLTSEQLQRRRLDDIKLIKLREAAIRKAASSETITVKRAIDCRRRPHVRQQLFYYGPLKDTPFSLILALPKAYGLNRLQAKLALTKSTQVHFSPSDYDLLTIHPEYKYCERAGQQSQWSQNDSLTTLLELFKLASEDEAAAEQAVELADLSAISEHTSSSSPAAPPPGATSARKANQQRQKSASSPAKFLCDKELFPSLLFDARATYEPAAGSASCCQGTSSNSFYSAKQDEEAASPSCNSSPDDMRYKLSQIYGLEMSFLATRSGLTRTRVFELSPRIKKLAALFIERHSKGLDESWYSRTVDWNMRSTDTLSSTVVSVPQNAYIRLIAKLRQRITQRHPAVNDTRANCDPTLDDDQPEEEAGQVAPAEMSPPAVDPHAPTSVPPPSSEPHETGGGGSSSSTHEPLPTPIGSEGSPLSGGAMQNDEPLTASTESAEMQAPAGGGQAPRIDYSQYSSFDFLDLLANSSVHIAATQAIIVQQPGAPSDQRTPVGVTGHLYDYATFARRFLNSTSLHIRSLEEGAANKVQICPDGQCPTKCGLRSDSIDCLLVDNNGFIVVGEELPHIGRSLSDYDEKLMASLVGRRVFQQVVLTDYQAICARNDQAEVVARQAAAQTAANAQSAQFAASAAASSASSALLRASLRLESVASRALANFASALVYAASTLYSVLFLRSALGPDELLRSSDPNSFLGQLYQWQRSALLAADAQSAIANQSLLALLPNKTYLRPCEKQLTLYDMRPPPQADRQPAADAPEYYETKCGCSAWYVYDHVPETNLLMLVVNTSTACRRCEPAAALAPSSLAPVMSTLLETALNPLPVAGAPNGPAAPAPQARTPAEDQVCAMLERDAQLYVARPPACLSSHPDEAQIHLCGAANQPATLAWLLAASVSSGLLWTLAHIIKCRESSVSHLMSVD